MEQNTDKKTLSFGKGITNTPSDLLSEDTELLESMGFVYKNGEMRAVQKAKKMFADDDYTEFVGKLIYVYTDIERNEKYYYFFADSMVYNNATFTDVVWVYYSKEQLKAIIFSGEKVHDVSQIGKTLIFATDKGMHYVFLNKDLGTDLPKPSCQIRFTVNEFPKTLRTVCNTDGFTDWWKGTACYDKSNGDLVKIRTEANNQDEPSYYLENLFVYDVSSSKEKYDNFQNAVQGHVNQARLKVKEGKRFAFPFFIRYALELYDGTYERISAPILCIPTSLRNNRFYPAWWNKDKKEWQDCTNYGSRDQWFYTIYAGRMWIKATIPDIGKWSDIVKNFVVFASSEIIPFKIDGKWNVLHPDHQVDGEPVSELTYLDSLSTHVQKKWKWNINGTQAQCVIWPEFKSNEEIKDEMIHKAQFYKLFEMPAIGCVGMEQTADSYIKDGVLETLEEQTQLKKDDYYGWTHKIVDKIYTYNKRLNIFNIQRKPYEGFNYFCSFDEGYGNDSKYEFYVFLKNLGSWVKSDIGPKRILENILYGWFYYPDPQATMLYVREKDGSHKVHKGRYLPLKEHPMLNGAYYCEWMPSFFNLISTDEKSLLDSDNIPSVSEDKYELLNSQIYTSVVNNPFVFEASGDNTVGAGTIQGIMANTEAVSQGQFGQYPLIVFTTEGIYGMGVNSEGLYSNSYPISREVCNNPDSIIPTDKMVYFSSEKGLMAVSGNTVNCMSEQMRGRKPRNFSDIEDVSFIAFLRKCKMAYDYRESLLRIYHPDYKYAYVYNMTDGTFGMIEEADTVVSIVNDYPDNLIQFKNGGIYSLVNKKELNEDEEKYSGRIVTRPLKLGGSIVLKSIRHVKNILDSDNGKIKLKIYGSNDCKHWQQLHSLGGKPWKYYTFDYSISDFSAADSFAGTIVDVQARRNDKMR